MIIQTVSIWFCIALFCHYAARIDFFDCWQRWKERGLCNAYFHGTDRISTSSLYGCDYSCFASEIWNVIGFPVAVVVVIVVVVVVISWS